jgi:hypothetical protein
MRKQKITDLESLDHAYVVAPNKIDKDRKANLIKSSLNRGLPSDSENARLSEPLFCHNISLLMRVV